MFFGILLATLALIGGIGDAEVAKFERSAAQEIASRLGGTPRVRVDAKLSGVISGALGDLTSATIEAKNFQTDGLPLFTEPERSTRGRVRSLNLKLEEFVLTGLKVKSLEASIPECRFDYPLAVRKRQIRLSRSGAGEGRVLLGYDDLAAYVRKRFPSLRSFTLRANRSILEIEGDGDFLLVSSTFKVYARLVSPDGKGLHLADARIFLGDKPADEAATKAILTVLNPVLDLDKHLLLKGAFRIETITILPEGIEARGKARIPEK